MSLQKSALRLSRAKSMHLGSIHFESSCPPHPVYNPAMPNTDRPNILFIESDQHNPAVIGAYGDSVIKTPNLDALAARGVVFTNNYCASPICVPSRTSMLTGQHPYQNEVWTNSQYLHSAIRRFQLSHTHLEQRDINRSKLAACTSMVRTNFTAFLNGLLGTTIRIIWEPTMLITVPCMVLLVQIAFRSSFQDMDSTRTRFTTNWSPKQQSTG